MVSLDEPLMLRIEKARNDLRFSVNRIASEYGLPGFLLDLVINAVLAEGLQQRVSLMSEQITTGEGATGDGGREGQPGEDLRGDIRP